MTKILISKSTLEGLRTPDGYRNTTISGTDYNGMWLAWSEASAELAQALLEANGKVQALAAENSAHKSAFKTILENCPVNHPDIDKAVVAMIAYDEAFNRVTPATAAAVAQIAVQAIREFSAEMLQRANDSKTDMPDGARADMRAAAFYADLFVDMREAK